MSDLDSWAQLVAQSVVKAVAGRQCRPASTYRIQFEPGKLTFRHAAGIVPYLNDLGISHLYASPCLKARSGSPHGYSIVDYARLNPELGDEKDYAAMVEMLHRHGMGQILDVVPNHMSATPAENPWWNDVLENGPASPHAAYFDIDWRPVKEELRNKVLLPILGDQYGQVLESGELKLEFREGAFFLRYFLTLLPIEPRSYRTILTTKLDAWKETQPSDSADVRELESIITALEHLPESREIEPPRIAERQREKEVIKDRLRTLADRSPAVADFIVRNVQEINGTPDDPSSYDALDKFLDAQVYRLSHWKAAADEINYRRFFDINELAAVCMETLEVFAESHRLVFELLVRGDVDGLRVDHIDGLYDPTDYLQRLQRGYLAALGKALYEGGRGKSNWGSMKDEDRKTPASDPSSPIPHPSSLIPDPSSLIPPPSAPPAWCEIEPVFLAKIAEMTLASRAALPLYVIVEKILGCEETLPEKWLLAGTTGYDFLNSVAGLFVEPSGLAELTNIYSRFIDRRVDFKEEVRQSKRSILRAAMSSELQLLAHRLNRVSQRNRRSRDFTLNTLRIALREILACFPVYRTYIREGQVLERDRQVVCRAVAQAKRVNPAVDSAVFDFIRDVFLLESPPPLSPGYSGPAGGPPDEAGRRERELFVCRVQQVTSSVMAKGVEDTAFYRYFPLASLNEVGGNPNHGAISIEDFHRHNLAGQAAWPQSLLSTSTHDTKRSEDARARISVLSEIPLLWRKAVNRWARLNRRHHREVAGQPAPSRNDEYLFYQSLVGVWPLAPVSGKDLYELSGRMAAYMEKATREAKVSTSWINPDAEYDAAVREFVAAVLDDHPKNRFLAEFRGFHEQIVNWGLFSALSQTLLKLTAPGVPDIYGGQETWDFSLVDPDNRRPVDFAHSAKLLARLRKDAGHNDGNLLALARQLGQDPRDPRLKLFVTWRVLQFRRRNAELFRLGDYVPLEVVGPQAKHVCAFARSYASPDASEPRVAIAIAPRLIAQLTPNAAQPTGAAVWGDTYVALANVALHSLKDVFTGQAPAVENARLPLAAALADFPVGLLEANT
jgi:(1->4)-alpha-D-glucan 1-alpha-D-glucosylmutase